MAQQLKGRAKLALLDAEIDSSYTPEEQAIIRTIAKVLGAVANEYFLLVPAMATSLAHVAITIDDQRDEGGRDA